MGRLASSTIAWFSADAARAALSTVLIVGTLGLLFAGRSIPDFLIVLDATAVGFFFGGITPPRTNA